MLLVSLMPEHLSLDMCCKRWSQIAQKRPQLYSTFETPGSLCNEQEMAHLHCCNLQYVFIVTALALGVLSSFGHQMFLMCLSPTVCAYFGY